ncbi:MAG TPA: hypothetical protein VIF57_07120 [Polyangia bacterium]
MSGSDVSGQAFALTVMTPIAPGAQDALRASLEGLRDGGARGPLARLEGTHFGRWVIVPDFVADKVPDPDRLATPQLLFTACFDGDLDSWLDELTTKLAPEAAAIWGRCAGAPEPAAGAALKAYLLAHRIKTGFFVAAYGDATVGEVRAALRRREALIAFAQRAQELEPAALQREFHERFGS